MLFFSCTVRSRARTNMKQSASTLKLPSPSRGLRQTLSLGSSSASTNKICASKWNRPDRKARHARKATLNNPRHEGFRAERRKGISRGKSMEPAFFSASHLFGAADSDEDGPADVEESLAYVEREHPFPGMGLQIREFSFHQVNANLLWPGTISFAQWLLDHRSLLEGRRILELGSGTGALAIFLKKALGLDITTSDYDDEQIENNISYNMHANGEPIVQHIRHTWGEPFPTEKPNWDLVIASDILLYVKQYPNLIKTLCHLLRRYHPVGVAGETACSPSKSHVPVEPGTLSLSKTAGTGATGRLAMRDVAMVLPNPCFLMSWRRRIPKQDEAEFFAGCTKANLQAGSMTVAHKKHVHLLYVYWINRRQSRRGRWKVVELPSLVIAGW